MSGGDTINQKYFRASETLNGKRYFASGKTQREADKKLAAKIASIKRDGDTSGGSMTVRQWSEEWLSTYVKSKVRKPGTKKLRGTMSEVAYKQRKSMVETYILPDIGNVKLRDVTPTMLQRVLNNDPYSSYSHVQKMKIALQHMFRQAWMDRKIVFDPSANLIMPATEKRSRRGMTAEEKTFFFKAAESNPHGLMFRFMLATGIRPNELMPLTVADLDLDEKTVYIHAAVESGTSVVGTPKTEAGTRYTIINTTEDKLLVRELRDYISQKDESSLLFVNTHGTMISHKGFSVYWESFAREMDLQMGAEHDQYGHIYDPSDLKHDGTPLYPDPDDPTMPRNGHKIAPDLVPYCLRHTFGTDMQRAGVPINLTRYMMGHTDISTTANVYIDSGKEDALQAVQLISPRAKTVQIES